MLLATLLLFFQTAVPDVPATSDVQAIPRYQMIADGLYRGGQPDREGFEYLKKNGVRTIINLRVENDEEAIVKELGMNYVHIPVSLKIWSKIPDRAIASYFKVLEDPANYPIFFHCRRGADRTGAVAGFYRIAVQGWEPRKAYSEARSIGMRWWFKPLKRQIVGYKGTRPVVTKTVEALQ